MLWLLLQVALWTMLFAGLVLVPAGTVAYAGGLALIALFGCGSIAMVGWLARRNPVLLRERMASPVQPDQEPWDRWFLVTFMFGFSAWIVFMAWDAARLGFAAVPVWLQVAGGIAILLYGLGVCWTFRENTFAAPVVKIQAGQKVIDSGPYAIVRHPMYASILFMFIGVPLLLGSWWGLLLALPFVLGLAWRTVREEQTLSIGLQGYTDYIRRVRYRYVPHIW